MSAVILQIGYTRWLMPSDTAATTIIKAMRGAVEVDSKGRPGKSVIVPRPHRQALPEPRILRLEGGGR